MNKFLENKKEKEIKLFIDFLKEEKILFNFCRKLDYWIDMKQYLCKVEPFQFVGGGFFWDSTEEGWEFWNEIQTKWMLKLEEWKQKN